MPGFLDGQSVEIPCPSCGHKTAKTVGWLKANHHFTCRCGARIEIKDQGFTRGVADAERAMDDLRRSLRNLGR